MGSAGCGVSLGLAQIRDNAGVGGGGGGAIVSIMASSLLANPSCDQCVPAAAAAAWLSHSISQCP